MSSDHFTSLQRLSVRKLVSTDGLLERQQEYVEVLPGPIKQKLLSVMCKRGMVHDTNLHLMLHSQVTYLDLSESDITDVGLRIIGQKCRNIIKLDLNSLKESRTCISDAGVIAVAEGCPRLSMLYIRRCLALTDQSIIAVAQHCLGLAELNISGCLGITDASLQALGASCSHLQSVNLSNTKVSDEGVLPLAMGVCSQHLKELHLEHCRHITDESIEAVMQFCPNMECLLFHGCPLVTEASRQALEEFLGEGREMKHLTWTIY